MQVKLLVGVMHAARLATFLEAGMESIEAMLYKQLLAAVGKDVTPVDFANYMVSDDARMRVADWWRLMGVCLRGSCTTTSSCLPSATSPRRFATRCGGPTTVSDGTRVGRRRAVLLSGVCARADPEGILSIEAQLADGTMAEPIQTMVRDARLDAPMKFALQPGVEVAFTGDVHLHGYVMHSFAGE